MRSSKRSGGRNRYGGKQACPVLAPAPGIPFY